MTWFCCHGLVWVYEPVTPIQLVSLFARSFNNSINSFYIGKGNFGTTYMDMVTDDMLYGPENKLPSLLETEIIYVLIWRLSALSRKEECLSLGATRTSCQVLTASIFVRHLLSFRQYVILLPMIFLFNLK